MRSIRVPVHIQYNSSFRHCRDAETMHKRREAVCRHNCYRHLGRDGFFYSVFFTLFPRFSVINPLWAGIGYMLLRGTMQLYDKRRNAIRQLSASYMAMFLVVFPLSLLSKLYLEANGHTTLLACLIFIWMNDTGAFCVGSLIGRHRLFERISPKKSWEGFWGGLFSPLWRL